MSSELLTQQRSIKRSPSVEKFRNSVRKEYKEKLRQGRNDELNRRRDLFKSTLSCIHEALTPDEQMILEAELLNADEMLVLFDEIEKELKYNDSYREAQQHNLYEEEETNSILNNLLDHCNVCDKVITNQNNLINNNTICIDCVKKYFNHDIFYN